MRSIQEIARHITITEDGSAQFDAKLCQWEDEIFNGDGTASARAMDWVMATRQAIDMARRSDWHAAYREPPKSVL